MSKIHQNNFLLSFPYKIEEKASFPTLVFLYRIRNCKFKKICQNMLTKYGKFVSYFDFSS